jgi:hypothetical protein
MSLISFLLVVLCTVTLGFGADNNNCHVVLSFSPVAQDYSRRRHHSSTRFSKTHRENNFRGKLAEDVVATVATEVVLDQRLFRPRVFSRSSLSMALSGEASTTQQQSDEKYDVTQTNNNNNNNTLEAAEVVTQSKNTVRSMKTKTETKSIAMPTTKRTWQVWKTILRLEDILLENANNINNNDKNSDNQQPSSRDVAASSSPLHPASNELVAKVLSILRTLATKHEGKAAWGGLLNKSTLLHEVEESILAIHFLQQELLLSKQQHRDIVLVDVCCGKGVFSLLSSYYFSSSNHNNNNNNNTKDSCDISVRKIIMLDKDPNLRWDHIDATNCENHASINDNNTQQQQQQQQRPVIECWPLFNLHEIDNVVDRLSKEVEITKNGNDNGERNASVSLAMVGIHLCKTLSPACIGIANALGPEKCPHLVLAPCCLPRVVVQSKYNKNNNNNSVLEVLQHETSEQRQQRNLAKQRRTASMVRGKGGGSLSGDRSGTNENPPPGACWKCGEFGHAKADCPSNQSTGKPGLIQPPSVSLGVSGILNTDRPFGSYCDLLATSIQRNTISVEETGLTNSHMTKRQKKQQQTTTQQTLQQANNWNRERKSIYIVASETVATQNTV